MKKIAGQVIKGAGFGNGTSELKEGGGLFFLGTRFTRLPRSDIGFIEHVPRGGAKP
jgi:hypothetical protein